MQHRQATLGSLGSPNQGEMNYGKEDQESSRDHLELYPVGI